MSSKTYYSIVYCTLHDSAFIVRGNFPYGLPTHFKNNNDDCGSMSNKCDHCDWINNGIISLEGTNISIVEKVETDLNKKYRGNFTLSMISNIFDENGNSIDGEMDSELYAWLKKK